eukprot:TRINITY_DN13538_c0_g1_i1.p1 TRINITY_DN13538_c0_g1~~TRINITY_DN13538_c0_g1_i1.p1  ORF type:complete len:359 (-),score=86.57 TRINITY_DN13538_c0_g1_i1:50-1126(-)
MRQGARRHLIFFILLGFIAIITANYPTNTALSFNGATQFVLVSHEATQVSLLDSWTIEAWIGITKRQKDVTLANIIGIPGGSPRLMLCGEEEKEERDVECKTGQILAIHRSPLGGEDHVVVSTSTLNDDRWHHVAATFDGSALRIIINGREENSYYLPEEDINQTIDKSTRDEEEDEYNDLDGFHIGGFGNTRLNIKKKQKKSSFFSGTIDEIRIWRVARSQEEIGSRLNHTLGTEVGLLYYWRLDEGFGSLISSRAAVAYGTLGAGWEPGEPQWIISGAPLTLKDPDVMPEPSTGTVTGASFLVMILFFSIGFICGIMSVLYMPNISNYFSSGSFDDPINLNDDTWEIEGLLLEEEE